jgi:HTH-type transcriptional regulator/antitoxin HipB
MPCNNRLADELGHQLREHREALGMSKSELAERAGKVREVAYRLEAGDDTTVSSLMAVLGALAWSCGSNASV